MEIKKIMDKRKNKLYTTLARNPKMLKKNKEAIKWLETIRGRLG